ncbi:hypothetical protein SELMODRAFT_160051 [Selaginella moellendorffii]|uniref:DNA-directed RNA polymerases I and III subunit RPAC2 n=1 Tax=Selaginella moellendorffii TaxID=88036 RepID=D8T102_SELML|nr:DNA-directed RNA polymerases I and III subunit RPAC2 [Selaginella moellendorffii]EFJ09715.1 hypothetical protein SELMODRAFT_160051 [Selaginella moellendorffii]|eukprot:XP_002989277.1 DNA-directed RNA polymerases I and III subunit RPAC2 [Selaginella moellendorffii]
MAVELGSDVEPESSTFCINDEDHTFGNSIRYVLNGDPRVTFCGYSVPHPSDNRVNVRVQTTGESAKSVFKDALRDLVLICDHVCSAFDDSVASFKRSQQQQ